MGLLYFSKCTKIFQPEDSPSFFKKQEEQQPLQLDINFWPASPTSQLFPPKLFSQLPPIEFWLFLPIFSSPFYKPCFPLCLISLAGLVMILPHWPLNTNLVLIKRRLCFIGLHLTGMLDLRSFFFIILILQPAYGLVIKYLRMQTEGYLVRTSVAALFYLHCKQPLLLHFWSVDPCEFKAGSSTYRFNTLFLKFLNVERNLLGTFSTDT